MGDFTPVSGLIGGLLIGLAVALMLLLNGRIAGVSGIVGGLVNPKAGDTGWRAAFVVGLPLGALAYILVAGGPTPVDLLASVEYPSLVTPGRLPGWSPGGRPVVLGAS